MNYYISDMHFCHKNILKYDARPWDEISSMEYDMIDWWNKKVTDKDDVLSSAISAGEKNPTGSGY